MHAKLPKNKFKWYITYQTVVVLELMLTFNISSVKITFNEWALGHWEWAQNLKPPILQLEDTACYNVKNK